MYVICISIKLGKIKQQLDVLFLKIYGGYNSIWTEVLMKNLIMTYNLD